MVFLVCIALSHNLLALPITCEKQKRMKVEKHDAYNLITSREIASALTFKEIEAASLMERNDLDILEISAGDESDISAFVLIAGVILISILFVQGL